MFNSLACLIALNLSCRIDILYPVTVATLSYGETIPLDALSFRLLRFEDELNLIDYDENTCLYIY